MIFPYIHCGMSKSERCVFCFRYPRSSATCDISASASAPGRPQARPPGAAAPRSRRSPAPRRPPPWRGAPRACASCASSPAPRQPRRPRRQPWHRRPWHRRPILPDTAMSDPPRFVNFLQISEGSLSAVFRPILEINAHVA